MDKNQTIFIEFFRKWYAENWKGTKRQLAEHLELSYSQLANILNGYRGGHETTRIKICEKIGIDYRSIINCGTASIPETNENTYPACSLHEPSGEPKDTLGNLVFFKHVNLIKEFKNPKLALSVNEDLNEIEKIKPERFEELAVYIKAVATELRTTANKNPESKSRSSGKSK